MAKRYLSALAGPTALAVLALAAVACSTDGGKWENPTPEKVSYMTAFGAAGRDAFIWVGKDKGYFTEVGIDLDINQGAAVSVNLAALATGRAQFGALDFTGAIIQAGRGEAAFRAIAAIHQRSLVSIVTLEGSGLTRPSDLPGRTLAAAAGSVNQLLFPAYAKAAGIDATRVRFVDSQPNALPTLLASGRVDGLSTFLIGKAAIEKTAGRGTVIMPYSEFLPDLYGNALVTSPDVAKNKPDLVKRFRSAALRALTYTIEHPDEAASILQRYEKSVDPQAAASEITLMTPYMSSRYELDEARVRGAIALLRSSGLIPNAVDPNEVVDFSAAEPG